MKSFAILALIAGSAFAAPASSGCAAAAAGNGTLTGDSCTAARTQLVDGIQANLDIQAQELKGIECLQKEVGTAKFKAEQTSVLAIQQKGIDIRAKNQQLAKEINSPAAAGLNIVAGAQVKEMMQVMSLTGTAEADDATLKTLVQEVQDGTKQNQKNLADAKSTKC
ncbi:hypothetical protein PTNB73_03705 [Pyrenophora teres f. teres]|uniref:Uncharacterized protein n=1 Tax=Pyrenophora teres f. teres TaxID=97479 RepID=A0A6S6W4Z9_9PLEO|nr:hypothetical protein HRS9139_02662 [Pyrenophora teres f. teres]KAE8844240.1 hypothetical protein PTNB85_02505 [Pyrenophora teres f. teres]KAE8866614.1 hypothetical protein PTNB29_03761 [Pyrenophora teres f. teres]KAE8872246.1 hypothetical protein PTNB73_03705 [Pyrenophora teres f. teres]CAE7180159.1 hypothetical protein PTTW11_06727 [Pyrenophora teres f. teres]